MIESLGTWQGKGGALTGYGPTINTKESSIPKDMRETKARGGEMSERARCVYDPYLRLSCSVDIGAVSTTRVAGETDSISELREASPLCMFSVAVMAQGSGCPEHADRIRWLLGGGFSIRQSLLGGLLALSYLVKSGAEHFWGLRSLRFCFQSSHGAEARRKVDYHSSYV